MIARFFSAALVSLGLAVPAAGQSFSGAYLAGTVANFLNDYDQVAEYYARALAHDPSNAFMLRQAMLASVATGDFGLAIPMARRLQAVDGPDPFSALLLYAEGMNKGQDLAALDAVSNVAAGFNPLLYRLLSAWANQIGNNFEEAERILSVDGSEPATALYSMMHLALMNALNGDLDKAENILSGPEMQPLAGNRLAAIARTQILSALGRDADALAYVMDAMRQGLVDEEFIRMAERLSAGESLRFEVIQSAEEGASEAILLLADALDRDESYRAALFYTQIAAYLAPRKDGAAILAGDILLGQGQYDLAETAYGRVPKSAPMFLGAQIGRSDAFRLGGKIEDAAAVLERLADMFPDNSSVETALGDLMRIEERYEDAAEHYDRAAALIMSQGGQPTWVLYYTRGIAHERIGNWETADENFRAALAVEPDQPLVLNYLGYSLVERREKLDEALAMIERAVEERPEDGYIVDSLAWVYYRLGRFEEAVAPMERAASLLPVDPIINDHLGDVLWMVGRKREARFQWNRALSFDPEEADIHRIRRKLEIGLDAVLAEEADAE